MMRRALPRERASAPAGAKVLRSLGAVRRAYRLAITVAVAIATILWWSPTLAVTLGAVAWGVLAAFGCRYRIRRATRLIKAGRHTEAARVLDAAGHDARRIVGRLRREQQP